MYFRLPEKQVEDLFPVHVIKHSYSFQLEGKNCKQEDDDR